MFHFYLDFCFVEALTPLGDLDILPEEQMPFRKANLKSNHRMAAPPGLDCLWSSLVRVQAQSA